MTNYCTPEELENLRGELKHLKTIETREIADLIRHTASFGDLKENFAYHDAKEKQAFLLGRILKLEETIRNAKIIEKKNTDRVEIGSSTLISLQGKEEMISIVSPSQTDPLRGKISYQSPLGSALLGKKAGQKFKVDIGGNKVDCRIIKID